MWDLQRDLQEMGSENATLKREQQYARIWRDELEQMTAQRQQVESEMGRLQLQAEGVREPL